MTQQGKGLGDGVLPFGDFTRNLVYRCNSSQMYRRQRYVADFCGVRYTIFSAAGKNPI